MPLLFISYKRGTAAMNPLMQHLVAAGYRLWYDKDDIHAGENWREAINRGVDNSSALVIGLTSAACRSPYVQHEVKRGLEQGKLLFPVKLEAIDESTDPPLLGLVDVQFIDFTGAESDAWAKACERLIADMQKHKMLQVTHHDLRQQRSSEEYTLHQRYLKKLADRVGWLNLAQISPSGGGRVPLEQVYIDSPTNWNLSVEVQDWHVVDWWLSQGREVENETRTTPESQGFSRASLEAMIGSEIDGHNGEIARYRAKNPDAKPADTPLWRNRWNNGTHADVLTLQVQDIAAARNRLVVLGTPGSGKSTFVKHLALCLVGSEIEGWTRSADLSYLHHWPHGKLLPIYIELRHFVSSRHFPQDIQTQPVADHLWAYIQHELLGAELEAYLNDLKKDVEQGYAVIILDGLDEVPYPEGKLRERQIQLIALADVLNSPRFERSRVIVASRPYAYENWTLPNFTAITITDFADGHRIALATRLYQVAGLADEIATEKARKLNQQLGQVDPQLKDHPLFLTMMAEVFLKGENEGLPTRRGALYRHSILLLLDRWTQVKPNAPTLVELLGEHEVEALYLRLAALAYEVQAHYGDQPNTPEIDEALLYRHLKPLGRTTAAELIPYLSENAGVLVSPGQDQDKDVFYFAHRTFQEYLAGAHLAETCLSADAYTQVRELILAKPQIWRMPCTLLGDVLADTGRRSELWRLLADLLPDDPSELASDAPDWWATWLAATITLEQELHAQTNLHRRTEQPTRDGLVDWLVALVETPAALPPVERAACGRALSLLGDPRKGVGIIVGAHSYAPLPEIDWVEIPAGDFIYQDGEKIHLDTYWMSRYPITFAQFQTFLDDPDGYANLRWFDGLVASESQKQMADQSFKYANHPRETVNWYQAIAFCRWFSARLGGKYGLDEVMDWAIRLPMEQEWEKAARGEKGLRYPYGNEFDGTKGNTYETGIRQTSAVGIFPNGASPYGLQDMSGNVWEWCLTEDESKQDDNLTNSNSRVIRGGSWNLIWSIARAVNRNDYNPLGRDDSFGFRVCCSFRPCLSVPPQG